MSVYYSDDLVTIHHGDVLDVLEELKLSDVDLVDHAGPATLFDDHDPGPMGPELEEVLAP